MNRLLFCLEAEVVVAAVAVAREQVVPAVAAEAAAAPNRIA
jgi:hypothetical protein